MIRRRIWNGYEGYGRDDRAIAETPKRRPFSSTFLTPWSPLAITPSCPQLETPPNGTRPEFIDCVRKLRAHSGVHESKELWFRGESRNHETCLRPQMYRPRKDGSMKPVREVLEIENQLYEEFRRCGVQLCGHSMNEDDPEWDWYFLMQRHGAPTRLLDWSDGALMALHFALQGRCLHQGNHD